jgi:hypothetical protein
LTIQKLRFSVDKTEVVEDPSDSHFATARIHAFSTGRSEHETTCDAETLRNMSPSLYDKPVIWEYDSRFSDFGSHNDGITIPAGFIVPNSAEFIDLPDGRVGVSVLAKIWKKYSKNFLDIFKQDNTSKKSVSVEMEVYDSEDEPSTGLLKLKSFVFAAVCILGDFVKPASPGANIEMVTFAKEYQKDFEYEFSSKYEDLDLSIPKKVKKNAQEGLDIQSENKLKISAGLLATARYLLKNSICSPEKIRYISKYFSRHVNDDLDDKTSNEYIAWQLVGGFAGRKWSTAIEKSMDELDDEKMSYFNAEESIGDIEKEEEIFMKKDKKEEVKPDEKVEETEMAAPEKEEMATPEKPETPEKEDGQEEMTHHAAPESDEHMMPEHHDEMAAEPKEDEKPESDQPEKEEKEEEFSFGFSVEDAMAMMPEDEKCAAEFAKGKDAVFSVIANSLFAACHAANEMNKKMAEDCKVHMAENEELKKFKSDREDQEKKFSVDLTLKEATEKYIIPDEDLNKMREDGYAVEFAQLETWQTGVKAKCFDFAVVGKDKGKEDVVRIALPFPAGSGRTSTSSPWPASKQ